MIRRGLLWILGVVIGAGVLPGCVLPLRHARKNDCVAPPPSDHFSSAARAPSQSGDSPNPGRQNTGPEILVPVKPKVIERQEPTSVPPRVPGAAPSTDPEPQTEPPAPTPPRPTSMSPLRTAEDRPGPFSKDQPELPELSPPVTTQVNKPVSEKNDPLQGALQCILENRPHEALNHLKNYDATTQDFFQRLLPALAQVAQKPLEKMNPEEVAVIHEQIDGLLHTLLPRAELVIHKMCFCESVKAFGVYRPLPEGHVFQAGCPHRPGDLVQVYVELRNICSECRDKYHETRLSSYVEVRDPRDPKGPALWKHRFDDSKQPLRSLARLHDYYNNYTFFVPHIPPGSYILTIQVTDQTREGEPRVARKAIDFKVAAGARE